MRRNKYGRQGWVCPNCGQGKSPSLTTCNCIRVRRIYPIWPYTPPYTPYPYYPPYSPLTPWYSSGNINISDTNLADATFTNQESWDNGTISLSANNN